jgi:hypothetical protein
MLKNYYNKIVEKFKGRSAQSKDPLDRQSYRCTEEFVRRDFDEKNNKYKILSVATVSKHLIYYPADM